MTINKQKGYIDIDFTPLFILAGIGLFAIVVGIPYLLYWIVTHISIVFV